jgi:hypothetical protein
VIFSVTVFVEPAGMSTLALSSSIVKLWIEGPSFVTLMVTVPALAVNAAGANLKSETVSERLFPAAPPPPAPVLAGAGAEDDELLLQAARDRAPTAAMMRTLRTAHPPSNG